MMSLNDEWCDKFLQVESKQSIRLSASYSLLWSAIVLHWREPFSRNLRPPQAPSDHIRKLQEWASIIFHRVLWVAKEPLTN